MGNIFLLLVLEIVMLGLIWLTRKATGRWRKVHEQASGLLIWNGVYKLLNEPYIVFVVSCFTQTLWLTWDGSGEVINNLMTFGTLVIVCPWLPILDILLAQTKQG